MDRCDYGQCSLDGVGDTGRLIDELDDVKGSIGCIR